MTQKNYFEKSSIITPWTSTFMLTCLLLISGLFSASAQTIWNAGSLTFTETVNGQMDNITTQTHLTRVNVLYNAVCQTNPGGPGCSYPGPCNTQWAVGSISNWNTLTYNTWINTIGCFNTQGILGTPLVVHMLAEDIYFQVTFTSWTAGGTGMSYTRTTLNCPLTPVPVASPTSICSGGSSTLSATSTGNAGVVTYTWNPGGLTGSSVSVSPTSTTIYTVIATDANCSITATVSVLVNPSPVISSLTATPSLVCSGGNSVLSAILGPPTYCTAGANTNGCSSGDEAISNVTFGSINNNSTCPVSGQYQDFTSLSTTVSAGSSYSISITNLHNFSGDQVSVWADWNQNGLFTDLGETYTLTYAATTTGSIAVPSGALNGPTRLRVRLNYTGAMSPCGTTTYGEVEDYSVNVIAGQPGATFTWSPSTFLSATTGSTVNANAVTATTIYTATITGTNGCTKTGTASVAVSAININCSGTNVSCFGGNNGSASVAATGNGPFTYLWSNFNTNSSISGLTAGTYCVTVTNTNGCTATCCYTVTQPPVISVSLSSTSSSCPFCPDGTAMVTSTSGGTPGYTYIWNTTPSQTAPTATGLLTGTYCVTVTDANGCTKSGCVFVPAAGCTMTANTTLNNNVTCFGGSNGSATASPGGGTIGPFTYQWDNGNSNATANNLNAGSHTVVINDLGTGCSAQGNIFISQPTAVTVNCSGSNVTCNGAVNGSASVMAGGGNPPYSYSWTGGGTNSSISGLSPGTYCVTVTDNSGCTGTCCYTVTQSSALTASCGGTNVTGCSNGTASVSASGGNPAYSYLWSNSGTTNSISGLDAGTYCVTVTDINGCTATCCYTVTGPSPIVITGYVTNICIPGGSTGNVDVSVSGGTPITNYSYNFNGTSQGWSSGIAGAMCFGTSGPSTWGIQGFGFAGQSYGTTSVGGEHSYIESPLLDFPAVLTLTAQSWSNNESGYSYPSCGGYDVEYVEYSTNGGSTWTPFFTTNQANLHGNSMAVWNALSYTATITPTSNGKIRFRYDNADGCCGGSGVNNGWYIDNVVISGTVPYYLYSWSNGATTQDISSVSAGTYTVTVTDGNGCTKTKSYTISQPSAALSASCSGTNISCNGGNNGSAGVTASGGTAPYTYSWSTGSPNSSISGLTPGIYCVTITDSQGCTATCCYTVTQPPVLTASCSGTNVSCNSGSNGSASVTAGGGTPPYSYLWSNSNINASQAGLPAGTYCVTVTDFKGCTATCCYTVTQPATALSVTETHTNVSCFGGNNGSATANASGGTPGYSYSWSTGSTNQSISGLTAGNYTCIVTDANGCTAAVVVSVTQPPQLFITETHVNVSCKFGSNGSIDLTLSGGTPPFTYAWSNGATTQDINGLNALAYFVTVTQGNGCTQVFGVNVAEPNAISIAASVTNPTSANPTVGAINLTVTGGTPAFSYQWNNGSTNQNRSGLSAGTYTVLVTDANGCTKTATFSLTLTCSLSFTNTVVQNASCFKNNGIVTVTASGGTSYTYAWQTSPVQTSATGTGLAYGTNSYVIITDPSSGCTKVDTVVVPLTTSIGVTLTSPTYGGGKNVSCNGGSNGAVNTVINGDPGPFSYSWSNGATTATLTGIPAGTYTLTVTTGSGGCTSVSQITLTQPSAVAANASGVNPSCGGNNGSATVVASGGTSPYSYSWTTSPIKTTATVTGLGAGTYTVTVTDANGCTKTAAVTLINSAGLVITGVVTDAKCNGSANGSIDITPSGGTPPYTYLWTGGATTQDRILVLAAGTYTVTVTDSKGCTGQFSATINQPSVITATSTSTNVSCFGGTNGTAGVTPSGGTPPYTYSWNTVPAKTTQSVTGLKKGTYTCLITDSRGCVKSVTITITEPPALTLGISKTSSTATANAGGGTPPYSYSWNTVPVQNTQTATGLTSGATYTVTTTDANGCTKSGSVIIPGSRSLGNNTGNDSYAVIYPNPTSGSITLTFNEVIQSKVSIEIYNLTGERVYTKEVKVETNSSSFNLDLSQLAKGVYTVKYKTSNNDWIDKLVIQ